MEEAPSPPDREEEPPSPGAALRTGFASFDAASFYELQHKEKGKFIHAINQQSRRKK
jgi:hypothetical protein